MNNARKTRRVAGISLAIAVAGASTIVPAQAQSDPAGAADSANPVSEGAAVTPTPAAKLDPNQVSKGIGTLQKDFDGLQQTVASYAQSKPGSGSSKSHYTAGGWIFTAVAYNSAAKRLYAISTGEDGKPAGHLLRMFPDQDKVADLGALDLKGMKTENIASAAFTARGELALFSGSEMRTLDFSHDVVDEKVEHVSEVAVKSQNLKVEGNPGNVGLPSAWASEGGNNDENKLFAVSRAADKRYYQWELDTTNGKITISGLPADGVPELDRLQGLNYAFTKKDGTLVFADDQAHTLEVKDGAVVATYFGNEPGDNIRELTYLRKLAKPGPETVTEAVAPLPGDTNTAAPEREQPLPGVALPTVVAPQAEPTVAADADADSDASTDDEGSDSAVVGTRAVPVTETSTETSTEASAQAREVNVTVTDQEGHAKPKAAVEVDEVGVYTATDRNGQAKVTLPAGTGDVTAYIEGEPTTIRAGKTSVRYMLLASNLSAEEGAEPSAEVSKKDVQLTINVDGKPVEGAKIKTDDDGVEVISASSDEDGLALVRVPDDGKSHKIRVKYNGQTQPVVLRATMQEREVNITSQKEQVNGKKIHVRVVTDEGDPVAFAEVYSTAGPNVTPVGVGSYETSKNGVALTNADGDVDVVVDGATSDQKVTLTVRTAPQGYKKASREVAVTASTVEIELPKGPATSTKSTPEQVLDLINQAEPVVAAMLGTAGVGAGLSGRGKSTSTSTKETSTSTSGERSSDSSGTVMTGRSTTAANAKSSGGSKSTAAQGQKAGSGAKSTSSKSSSRDGDLAETGTPMRTVITLGILAMLIGGAYIALGRRRDA